MKYKVAMFQTVNDKKANLQYREYVIIDAGLTWAKAKEFAKKTVGAFVVPDTDNKYTEIEEKVSQHSPKTPSKRVGNRKRHKSKSS